MFLQNVIKLFAHKMQQLDQKKVELIKNLPVPNFIDQYATITATSTQLVHKNIEWYFGHIQLTTFEFIKTCLVNYPIL